MLPGVPSARFAPSSSKALMRSCPLRQTRTCDNHRQLRSAVLPRPEVHTAALGHRPTLGMSDRSPTGSATGSAPHVGRSAGNDFESAEAATVRGPCSGRLRTAAGRGGQVCRWGGGHVGGHIIRTPAPFRTSPDCRLWAADQRERAQTALSVLRPSSGLLTVNRQGPGLASGARV